MTVTIEVKCDDATHLYWREQNTSTWAQLTTSPDDAPVITAPQAESTTFRFVQYSGSSHTVVYRVSPSAPTQSLPQSVTVTPGNGNHVYFAQSSASPRWYAGYVKVPPGGSR